MGNRVQGDTRSIPHEPEKDPGKADAAKFHEKLKKVEESGEAEKKEKRALKKQPQEEEEETKETGQAPAAGAFQGFMSGDQGDNILNTAGGARASGSLASGNTPLPPSSGNLEMSHDERDLLGGPNLQRGPAEPPVRQERRDPSHPEEDPLPPEKLEAKEKKESPDTSLLAGKTKRGALKKKKDIPPSEIPSLSEEEAPEEVFSQGEALPPEQKETKAPEKVPLSKAQETPPSEERAPATGDEEASLSEEVKSDRKAATPQQQTKTVSLDKDEKKHKVEESDTSTKSQPALVSSEAPATASPAAIVPESSPPSAYAKLHPELSPLFDRMVGVMTIAKQGGDMKMSVTLDMPGSVFNGSEIVLNRYSSAPNSFNIELRSSPEALQLFSENIGTLATAFSESGLGYQVNIQKPVLKSRYRVTGKGKESSGKKK